MGYVVLKLCVVLSIYYLHILTFTHRLGTASKLSDLFTLEEEEMTFHSIFPCSYV